VRIGKSELLTLPDILLSPQGLLFKECILFGSSIVYHRYQVSCFLDIDYLPLSLERVGKAEVVPMFPFKVLPGHDIGFAIVIRGYTLSLFDVMVRKEPMTMDLRLLDIETVVRRIIYELRTAAFTSPFLSWHSLLYLEILFVVFSSNPRRQP